MKNGINVLSLCDGISCGQVALKKAGIKVNKYYASEIDKSCIEITQKNFPNTIQLGDMREINTEELPKINLLMAGTPCQDLSSFNQKRQGLNGTRSSLFWHFVKIKWEVEPKFFLLENVRMKKEWADIITKELGVNPIEINSADFSAQNRRRLYWTNIPILKWSKKNVKFKDVLNNLPFRDIPKCFFTRWGDKRRMRGLNWVFNQKGNCLTTKNCHTNQYLLNRDKSKIRLLSADEFERLQTLPIGYTKELSNSERFKVIGNGWTINVIAHLLRGLNEAPNFTQLSLPSADGDIIIAKSNKIKDFTSDSSADGRTFADTKGI